MATEINAGRVAMVPKGEWSASTAYTRLDVVQYNGSSYVMDGAYNPGEMEGSTTYSLPYWMGRYHNMLVER